MPPRHAVPLAAELKYDFRELGPYLGNVGLMFSKEVIATTVMSFALFAGFIIWMNLDVETLRRRSNEDDVIESMTAILFLVSAIGFFIVMAKSEFLKQRGTKSVYLMTLA